MRRHVPGAGRGSRELRYNARRHRGLCSSLRIIVEMDEVVRDARIEARQALEIGSRIAMPFFCWV